MKQYQVRKFNPALGLPRWRASAYDKMVAVYRTLKAAAKYQSDHGPDYWVVVVSEEECCSVCGDFKHLGPCGRP